MVRMAVLGGYRGRIVPVNPGYQEIEGLPCFPALAAIPDPVDHVVLAVANTRLEEALQAAIDHGARAATIFGSCFLPDDGDPPLAQRLAARARVAGLPVCGGNCMGFYNLVEKLRVAAFPSPLDMLPGGITFIAQSGSVFGALAHNDRRLRFNLVVSPGAELVTTAADYMEWSLEQESTRVIGLFLETVRDPHRFGRALARAAARRIPVVALKVGRTEVSARMAHSHTGAMAGSDAAYEALFGRYGVHRAHTLDELAAILLVFAQPRRAAPGALAAIHDSGGEREMMVDLAAALDVPLADIGAETRVRLAARLESGLEPTNPLDAWGTGKDFEGIFGDCLAALLADPGTALGVFFNDIRDGYYVSEGVARAVQRAAAETAKPVMLATNYTLVRHEGLALRLVESGIPVIDGTREALLAVRALLAQRDFERRAPEPPCPVRAEVTARWRERLAGREGVLEEAESLALLAAYGVPVVPHRICTSAVEAIAAGSALGYPVALKTAAPGIHHKSDVGGVVLGIRDETALRAAWDDLAARLGPRVLVAAMAPPGVEIGLGAVNDRQFGPYVMVAAGGTLIELLGDRAYGLAPFGTDRARALIGRLATARVLQGARGTPPADVAALAAAAARLSELAHDLQDYIAEIDVNPVFAGARGCVAADALVTLGRGVP